MRLPIGVSTQTHKLVQALRVPKTSARLFTIRPKPTYYRLVVDGDQRLPERPADVCMSTSRSLSRERDPPARAAHAPDKCPPSSSPQSRSKRLGTARGRADCKRRATRDNLVSRRHGASDSNFYSGKPNRWLPPWRRRTTITPTQLRLAPAESRSFERCAPTTPWHDRTRASTTPLRARVPCTARICTCGHIHTVASCMLREPLF